MPCCFFIGFTQTFCEHRKRLKQRKMAESLCKVTVAIDMGFEHLMNQRDLGKCLKQLLHCYSINRRLQQPLQFHISSFDGERLKQEMERHQGYEHWDCIFHNKSYFDVFTPPVNNSNCTNDLQVPIQNATQEQQLLPLDNKIPDQTDPKNFKDAKNIIYLTSESENVLEKFDPNCVYIIGGLVDHNNHKGICHRLAVEKGINHARFPIQEAGVEMKTRQVLTIDHVFRIIASVASEGRSWKEALIETLPERKGAIEANKLDNSGSDNETTDSENNENNKYL
jgi:tRNA (guanine9-N1)-methyltransferase